MPAFNVKQQLYELLRLAEEMEKLCIICRNRLQFRKII
jgi:hypothetical protein